MIEVSLDAPMAAVEIWDGLFFDLDPPAHPRFAIDFHDAEAVSHIFLEDVLGWIKSWDDASRDELRKSLEYFLIHESELLGERPNGLTLILDDPDVCVRAIWWPLFEAVFNAKPEERPLDMYEVRRSTGSDAFASRLPTGPVFAWDTTDWRAELVLRELNFNFSRRTTFVQASSADDVGREVSPLSSADLMTVFDVSSQGLVVIRCALHAHDLDLTSSWVPPAPNVLASAPLSSDRRNGHARARLFDEVWVYGNPDRFAELPAESLLARRFGDIKTLLAQLQDAAEVLGIELSGDLDAEIERAYAMDQVWALPHEPWRTWAVLWQAAHSAATSLAFLRIKHG